MKTKRRIFASSDARVGRNAWTKSGGRIDPVLGTGDERWSHPLIERSLTMNCRRKDLAKKATTLINRVWRDMEAANDSIY
ncbi:MAG: hypothetical protein EXR28_14735 [Betaproteobacteria bacterium]|nr:hypothetical protein [Betaproteobacteria bacterium]